MFRGPTVAGGLVADTGFSAAGLAPATIARIEAGQANGTLDPAQLGAVPVWLRDVINGLRPVPRGVSKALIGDADGVTSLKHAFSEPLTRRETLDALAVIGRGRAGEDEILAAAVGDAAPEIRRRGVEVAAAIDRRLGNGAHAPPCAAPSATSRPMSDWRSSARFGTLPAHEATDVLAVARLIAIRDIGAPRRRRRCAGEEESRSGGGGGRAPAESSDGNTLRNGSASAADRRTARRRLRGRAATPGANTSAPEEARIAALVCCARRGPGAGDEAGPGAAVPRRARRRDCERRHCRSTPPHRSAQGR